MFKKTLFLIISIVLTLNCSQKTKKVEITESTKVAETTKKSNKLIEKVEFRSYIYNEKEISEIPKEITSQLPKDYTILDVASGNLNEDNFKDFIISIKEHNEQIGENGNAPNRILMIFVGSNSNNFNLEKINNKNAILGLNYGTNRDDPFLGVKIGEKSFVIEHGVASGNAHWKQFEEFEFNQKRNNWILTKSEITAYSESYEKGLKYDKQYGLQIRNHIIRTQKDFGIVTIDKFENK